MEISFCSHPNTKKVIATIFGTWHDSWAVVACAKFCRDIIISYWIRAKWNFHRIWIVMEKSLVKWVPLSESPYQLFSLSGRNGFMMLSTNGIIFRVTGPLCDRLIPPPPPPPPPKASDAKLWCFLWSALRKQWWGLWFETPSCSLWRHCTGAYMVRPVSMI